MNSNYVIRRSKFDEYDKLWDMKRIDKPVYEFLSAWTLWKNWKAAPPVIVLNGDVIIGIHAYTFSKVGYCTSYYIWTHMDYRRQGLGIAMVDYMLQDAYEHSIRRLKMNTSSSDAKLEGYNFWTGFGFLPFALNTKTKQYIFDQDIQDIDSLVELLEFGDAMYDPSEADVVTYDKRSRNRYKKQDTQDELTWLNSVWEDELGKQGGR